MNAIVVWFAIGAALMLAELFTPAFIICFFGVGAWGGALTAWLWPGLEHELGVAIVVSLLSLFFLRGRLVNTFQGNKKEAITRPEFPHAGRQGTVTQAIPANGEGEISLGGSFWRATSAVLLPEGTLVKAIAPTRGDELLLIVEPWSHPDN